MGSSTGKAINPKLTKRTTILYFTYKFFHLSNQEIPVDVLSNFGIVFLLDNHFGTFLQNRLVKAIKKSTYDVVGAFQVSGWIIGLEPTTPRTTI